MSLRVAWCHGMAAMMMRQVAARYSRHLVLPFNRHEEMLTADADDPFDVVVLRAQDPQHAEQVRAEVLGRATRRAVALNTACGCQGGVRSHNVDPGLFDQFWIHPFRFDEALAWLDALDPPGDRDVPWLTRASWSRCALIAAQAVRAGPRDGRDHVPPGEDDVGVSRRFATARWAVPVILAIGSAEGWLDAANARAIVASDTPLDQLGIASVALPSARAARPHDPLACDWDAIAEAHRVDPRTARRSQDWTPLAPA